MKYILLIKQHTISLLFTFLSLIVLTSLFEVNENAYIQILYFIFSLCIFCAYFLQDQLLKHMLCISSVILIVGIGIAFPVDIEVIEEIYIFIPLLYLFVYPGKFWPILISILLLSAYIPSLATAELFDVIEDGLELVFINVFATVMVYFQQKSLKQMEVFRLESYTDYLTRLPNRKKFNDELTRLKNEHKHSIFGEKCFALLIIDLDEFKKVNDQLGHLLGDRVLRMVAARLEGLATKNKKVYRIGGDEFAFIVNTGKGFKDLKAQSKVLAKAILKLSNQQYKLQDKTYAISASIGISFYPYEADEIEMLCSNADLAMYKAKECGKNTFSFYENSLMEKTKRKYELENDLKSAIENNEFHIVFQPKVDLKTDNVNSAEALLRWNHPKYGAISPAEFIPIAEQSGSIVSIGEWVLNNTCNKIVTWKKSYQFERIAVNVSSVQLAENYFSHTLKNILSTTKCSANWLEVEQTESWIMNNPDTNIRVLKQLKNIGVILSLDDFGTAYSSLSQVGRLPLDIIKIDKSFVDNCVNNDRDHMIVRTIIQLGQNLGMKIVAEGVEHENQKQLLKCEKCDEYQGFLFSKPLPEEEFLKLLTPISSNETVISINQKDEITA